MERKLDTCRHERLVAEESLFREAHAVLQEGLKRAKITQRELARRLNVSEGRVSQIMSGSENLTLRSFAGVAWAIGLSLAIYAQRAANEVSLGREPVSPSELTTHGKIEISQPPLPEVYRRVIDRDDNGIAA